jgi:hypothetical protein
MGGETYLLARIKSSKTWRMFFLGLGRYSGSAEAPGMNFSMHHFDTLGQKDTIKFTQIKESAR